VTEATFVISSVCTIAAIDRNTAGLLRGSGGSWCDRSNQGEQRETREKDIPHRFPSPFVGEHTAQLDELIILNSTRRNCEQVNTARTFAKCFLENQVDGRRGLRLHAGWLREPERSEGHSTCRHRRRQLWPASAMLRCRTPEHE
jgi:hypothetical protein